MVNKGGRIRDIRLYRDIHVHFVASHRTVCLHHQVFRAKKVKPSFFEPSVNTDPFRPNNIKVERFAWGAATYVRRIVRWPVTGHCCLSEILRTRSYTDHR